MISSQQHMHLIHDLQDCQSENMKIFKLEKSFDKFLNPKLFIHTINLNYLTEDNKWTSIDQQYFVDQHNQVHLMFPNYLQKSTKYKHIDLIKQMTSMDSLDHRVYKKIISIDFTDYQQNVVRRNSFIQRILCLKKILNFADINKDQVFTFCKDPLDQVLYITPPDVNQISMILMRDHHCEECFDLDVNEMKDSIVNMVNENILEIFKNFDTQDMSRLSKKSMTRMKKMENHINVRFPNFNLDEVVQDEDE